MYNISTPYNNAIDIIKHYFSGPLLFCHFDTLKLLRARFEQKINLFKNVLCGHCDKI